MGGERKKVVKNYIYNLTYQILTLILPIITTPYLARVLGAEGTGIYSYTFSITTYFILFGSLGVALYGQREIAYAQDNPKERKRKFLEIVSFRFITIAIAIIVFVFAFVRQGELAVYYKILLLELIAGAFDISWFFQGLEEFKKTVTRNILVRLVSVTCIFIFVKERADLEKYIFIYSLADLVGNLSLWLYLPKYLKGIKVEKLYITQNIPQILLLFIPQVSNQLYKILDTTMLGTIIKDKAETGYYEQSQKVIRLLLTLVTSLGVVMLPRMANTFAKGEKKQIKEYMIRSLKFTSLLAFPMMFGVATVAKEFVPIFFGDGYEKVVLLIRVMCPIIILMGFANIIGTQYLVPVKRNKEYTISILVGLIANFFMNYFMIHAWQSLGASIATVLSQLLIDIVQLYMVRDVLSAKEVIKTSYKFLIAGLVMVICCQLVGFLSTGIINVASQVAVGVIVYVGMLFLLKESYVTEFATLIKNKIKKK
jgi:O-antigen/teichoic acid export membrane protein